MNLSSPSGTVIEDSQGIGTIVDNDAQPSLSINSVSITEGDSGTTNAVFTVTLSPVSGQSVTVDFNTVAGSATAGADFTATAGALTFAAGQSQLQITVSVTGDLAAELDETFQVELSNAVNAAISASPGIGTILDDEPRLSIGDVTIVEPDSGSANAIFTVTLTETSTNAVTVVFSTANGTATDGSDYQGVSSGTLTIAAGSTTGQITVQVLGDLIEESDESFFVNLSNAANATIGDSQGQANILDNDRGISINSITVTEGNGGSLSAVFTVTLSQASGVSTTVAFATSNGTATAGTDYTTASGTVTFAPGQTARTITVQVLGDTLNENDETFNVTLSGAVNGVIQQAVGVGTIADNDPLPQLSINNVSVVEGNSGTVNAVFAVTLNAASGREVTVAFATASGSANGADFTATSGTLTFAAGAVLRNVTVPIVGDTADEPSETFTVTLSNAVNATLPAGPATGTILDDDTIISIADTTVTEANAAVNAVFIVSLSRPAGVAIPVSFNTTAGTATLGADFTSASGTIVFSPGETARQITVSVASDFLDEANETFNVNLQLAGNAGQFGDNVGVGTILDDADGPPRFQSAAPRSPRGTPGPRICCSTLRSRPPAGSRRR